jgi:diguanylate cyclase (GGDEF)-like protein
MGDEPGDKGDGKSPSIPPAATLRPDQTLRMSREMVEQYRQGQQVQRKGSLLVIAGDPADVGMHRLVEGEVVLGREPTGFHLRDGQISRQHAAVSQDPAEGQFLIRDLGSTNGTLLNGTQVMDQRSIHDGDQIQLGNTVIKFTLVDNTEADYLRRIARIASTDSLTGLVAKHRFDALLETMAGDAVARGIPFAALMMDMDNLKAVNDAHGHHTGAGTIQQVGELIGRIVGGKGEACRFGGDEFSAYLYGQTLAQAKGVAEEIRASVETTEFEVMGKKVKTSISIGVAEMAAGKVEGQELLARADKALYRAKAKGRNCVSD